MSRKVIVFIFVLAVAMLLANSPLSAQEDASSDWETAEGPAAEYAELSAESLAEVVYDEFLPEVSEMERDVQIVSAVTEGESSSADEGLVPEDEAELDEFVDEEPEIEEKIRENPEFVEDADDLGDYPEMFAAPEGLAETAGYRSGANGRRLRGDFNGDGYDDLAIGVPSEDVISNGKFLPDAGIVHVVYGSPNRLDVVHSEVWHQDRAGILGVMEAYDYFGKNLAVGDFNNDGFDDLAIGVPHEDLGTAHDAGVVQVLYGARNGLSDWDQVYHQDVTAIIGAVEDLDRFGFSIAVGDFNGDNYDDLSVGIPHEDLGSIRDAGMVQEIFGSYRGLSNRNQAWHQDQPGIAGMAERDDQFGLALTTGDFNRDGRDDLAVGVPFENLGPLPDAGVVQVLYGNTIGLTAYRNLMLSQNTTAVSGIAEHTDLFGAALAAGDFNGDGRDDLVVGIPQEDVFGTSNYREDQGAIQVFYSNANGVSAIDRVWHQSTTLVAGTAEAGDEFGSVLAVARLDNDTYDDLVIGIPAESFNPRGVLTGEEGALQVVFGSATGLNFRRDQIWHANSPRITGLRRNLNHFGTSTSTGDYDGNGTDDIAAAVPDYLTSGVHASGAVSVFFMNGNGWRIGWDQRLTQRNTSLYWIPERGDRFGTLGSPTVLGYYWGNQPPSSQ